MSKRENINDSTSGRELNAIFLEEDIILLVDKFTKIESASLRFSILDMVVELSDGNCCVSCGEECQHLSMVKLIKHLKHLNNQKVSTVVHELLEEYVRK